MSLSVAFRDLSLRSLLCASRRGLLCASRRGLLRASRRGLLRASSIEIDGCADERLERLGVNLLTLVNVDGAPHVPVQARVEELGRIIQGGALEEGQLHDGLVRLTGADAAVVIPDRGPHPLPLFHHVWVCLRDEGAHPCECIASPVTQLGNPPAYQFRCRFACCPCLTLHLPTFGLG